MRHIFDILFFLDKYSFAFLLAGFGLLALFTLINTARNPYRPRNRMFARCKNELTAASIGASISRFCERLDEEYRRQWRMYSKTNGVRPSAFMEFAPIRKKTRCVFVFVLSAITVGVYCAVFFLDVHRIDYLLCQAVFGLAAAWSFAMKGLSGDIAERKSRKLFRSFTSYLDVFVSSGTEKISYSQNTSKEAVDNAVEQINAVKKEKADKTAAEIASEVLRDKGLSGTRTVEQQRKLNCALNGLLQAYADKAAKNKNGAE